MSKPVSETTADILAAERKSGIEAMRRKTVAVIRDFERDWGVPWRKQLATAVNNAAGELKKHAR